MDKIDQKLLSQTLKLITEKGSRRSMSKKPTASALDFYNSSSVITTAADTTITAFKADPRLVRNQRRLRMLKDRTLAGVSHAEFDALRYAIEHANESLPPSHCNTQTQMHSHALGLMRKLGDPIFEYTWTTRSRSADSGTASMTRPFSSSPPRSSSTRLERSR